MKPRVEVVFTGGDEVILRSHDEYHGKTGIVLGLEYSGGKEWIIVEVSGQEVVFPRGEVRHAQKKRDQGNESEQVDRRI